MAGTIYGVNDPKTVKHWSPQLYKQALKGTSFLQYVGNSANSLCQFKTELETKPGDRVRFMLRMQLSGAGVTGDNTLEGNEEALSIYHEDVVIDQLRHAVRSGGRMSEQRVVHDFRTESKDGLGDWFANRFDTAFFNQLAGMSSVTDVALTGMNATVAPDSDHIIYGTAGSEASLSASSVFTLGYIDTLVEKATTMTVPIRPIDLGRGMKKYVLFMHPYQVTDMRTNTSTGQWLDIQKAAMSGGQITNNPIYSGALGEYNNTILVSNTRVPSATNNVRRAIFCGAQAASWAFGASKGSGDRYFDWEEETFDFGNQLAIAGVTQFGIVKNRFNSSDVGTIVLSTWAAAHG